MSSRLSRAALAVLVASFPLAADAQVAPRIVIAFDTSGSMALDLDGTTTFGDGVTTGCSTSGGRYCGTNCTAGLDTDCNGEPDDSRMFIAKNAVQNMVLAFGDVDWGLARFVQRQGTNRICNDINSLECNLVLTSYGNPQCNSGTAIPTGSCPYNFTDPIPDACEPSRGSNPPLRLRNGFGPTVCINYEGLCNIGSRGGDMLVGFPDMGAFAGMNNTYGVLSWLDGTETNFVNSTTTGNFCDSAGTGDCELRPSGPTPLEGLLREVESYIVPIRASDPRASCRPYSVILLTDGEETCSGDPEGAAAALLANGISTYVVGLAISTGSRTQLNDIATAGGTDAGGAGGDTAFFADDQVTLSAGLSAIVRDSLLVETCNLADDDCDGLVDEGVTNACGTCGAPPPEACNASDDDCDGTVDEGVSNPCGGCGTTPTETCNRLDDDCDGIIDEDGSGGDICAGCSPTAEVCDNIDNDCDGTTDEGLTRECGTDVGACDFGSQTCSTGSWGTCTGGIGPAAEECDGIDNDCDGTIDSFTEPCGESTGECVPGNRLCTSGSWGSCIGSIGPSAEVCDGRDNDCDGTADEGDPGGGGTCGTALGICDTGTLQCMGGALTCVGGTGPDPSESCNGADDDCDGATDEGVPTMGACGDDTGECSAGVMTCSGGTFTCVGARGPTAEICDGRDNDCDGTADEGNPGGGVSCGSSTGICTTGTSECIGGSLQCVGGTPPGTETCDGTDEDCDGSIDEGVPTMGACGDSTGECNPGVMTCVSGAYACVGARGATPEVCDGLDNDCDGTADEGNPEGGATCGTMVGLCEVGTLTCTSGSLVCVGETGPSPEACDAIDNDCDTLIDEGFFDGTPCGTDLGICVPGTNQCTTGGVACVCPLGYSLRTRADGTELCVPESTPAGPLVEECNSFDDDCDGIIDEGLGVGGPCGSDEGLCMPGEQRCVDGRVVCVGEVGPEPEGCDCEDNDCDGATDEPPDTGTLCPAGSTCVECQCALPCEMSEFGFTCPTGKTPRVDDAGMCFCVAERCDDDACATETVERDGEVRCAPDRDDVSHCVCDNNECTFPCEGVVCADGTVCDPRDPLGRCVEDNCRGLGCPSGEVCNRTTLACEADACADVTCAADEACRDGDCEETCAGVECSDGERCRAGTCETDPCAAVSCDSGEACDPASGDCVTDLCGGRRCPSGEICELTTGNCVADPCNTLHCPSGTLCEEGECVDDMVVVPDAGVDAGIDGGPAEDGRDRVLASGGCSCTVGASEPASGGSSAWLLALGLLGAVLLRRRRRGRRRRGGTSGSVPFGVALAVAAAAGLASGCEVDPFCLDCDDGVDAGAVDGGGDAGARDAGRRDAGPRDAGVDGAADACLDRELCNDIDDDCDGTVDEGTDTDTDTDNCGACGNACAPEGAFPSCVDGVCGIDRCDVGRHDLNDDPSDGCEYRCLPTAEDDTICDLRDNDCDGATDEDIDTTTDINHCGSCGRTCRFAHATATCTPMGSPPMGTCVLDACDADWFDADGVEGTGCEYNCTPTSDPTEICDATDNDCDPSTADGASDPDMGASCGSTDVGACSLGTYTSCDAGRLTCTGSVEPRSELCNDTDDDCDGSVDETNPEGGAVCAAAVGVCVTGRRQCVSGGTLDCQCPAGFTLTNDPGRGDFCVPTGSSLTELCNGLDDDCDGTIDEGDPEGGGNCGSDVGACTFGTETCTGGVIVCMGGTGPSAEVCDGVDNDCDPSTADGSGDSSVGGSCGTDLGVCSPGTRQCSSGSLSCVCPSGYTLTTSGTPFCVPTGSSLTEACNSLDDDCDGGVDEGNPEGGASCGTSTGSCSSGTMTCSGGALSCSGATGPTLETCNTVDDDCDGSADEDFDLTNDLNHCGSCGTVCSFPNAVPDCDAGSCVIAACLPGFVDLDPAAPGCEYPCSVSGSEICNGQDDDCDGATDEALTPPSTFCNPNGVCSGSSPACGGTSGWECSYPSTHETTEVSCDGLDNDCDGVIDDPFPSVGSSCGSGTGACRRTGVVACTADESGTFCTAGAAGTPAADESCNNIDDDCDGTVDEAIPVSAIPTVEMPSPAGGTFRMMQYEASRPDATSGAAGQVDTHACSNPNVLPWTNVTWTEASDACSALGSGWRLCDAPDWQAACVGPTSSCEWSYASSCASSAPLTCNGEEHDSASGTSGDQDALYPTGSGDFAMCFADWGSDGVVYDLSGNVKEWTNTEQTAGVYEIRGGSYNNVEPGRTCFFDFTVGSTGFAFPNTGFRCCHY